VRQTLPVTSPWYGAAFGEVQPTNEAIGEAAKTSAKKVFADWCSLSVRAEVRRVRLLTRLVTRKHPSPEPGRTGRHEHELENPATGEKIADVPAYGESEPSIAVSTAKTAQALWAAKTAWEHERAVKTAAACTSDHARMLERVCGRPVGLALHGSSGLSEDDLKRAVAAGIVKVNWSTESLQIRSRAASEFYEASEEKRIPGAPGFVADRMRILSGRQR
jgi:acyl-CoA reductase-like NAD-dependent aldehyde dehydrogenase